MRILPNALRSLLSDTSSSSASSLRSRAGASVGRKKRSLRDDQQGGILLVGLFMGFVLICALAYLFSVANALVQQERLQLAADAVAFQTAIWHARGMNLLALMNMVMAVLMTVVVAIRIVQLVMVTIFIVCALVAAPTGIGEAVCGAVGTAELIEIVQIENTYSMPILNTVKYLTWAEAGVAIAVPYLATGPGLAKTTAFYRERGVPDHNAFSLSMLPTTIDLALSVIGGPVEPRIGWVGSIGALAWGYLRSRFTMDPGPLGAAATTEGWPSLPVEGDNINQLCSRTGEVIATSLQNSSVPHMALELIGPEILPAPIMNAIDQTDQLFRVAVGDFFGISVLSNILCEPLMSMVNRLVEKITGLPNLVTKHIPAVKAAVEAAEKALDGSQFGKAFIKGFLGTHVGKLHPAKLWSLAANGKVFLRTWASVGSPAQSRWAFAKETTPGPGQAVASAEYYASCYSIDDVPFGSVLLRDCEDDAMWRIGWSARMRRVRPLKSELDIEHLAGSVLADAVGNVLPFGNSIPVQNFLDWLFTDYESPAVGVLVRSGDVIEDTWLVSWLRSRINAALDAHEPGTVIH